MTRELIIEARDRVHQAREFADWDTAEALKIAEAALAFAQNLAFRREEISA